MRFSDEFITRVLEANNIVDIISQYTQLRSSGGNFMGRCPFPDHNDKTASFSVSDNKQVFYCFGCGKKGNVVGFLKDYNGMSFPEAIEFLAGRAHIPMPVEDLTQQELAKRDQTADKKKKIFEINRLATQFFHDNFVNLPDNHPAKVYARTRGLSNDIIQAFKIGYSTENWDDFVRLLERKKLPLSLAEEARLIKARTNGKSGYFDLFRERLMFPILNTLGESVAFGGRILAQGEPKYLNSPETLVFHKSKTLYGLHETAKYARTMDQLIIVEGYMDLIAMYRHGFKNVAATMGTALTQDHARIIKRMTRNVVVLFDGDDAGQTAAERSLPILLAGELHPKGLILPDDNDPDDFLENHPAQDLQNLLEKSQDLFSVILGNWTLKYKGDASEKIQLVDKMIPIFQSIADARLRSLYVKEFAQKIGVTSDWMKSALENGGERPSSTPFNNRAGASASENIRPDNLSQNSNFSNGAVKKIIRNDLKESLPNLEQPAQIKLNGASAPEITLMRLALKNGDNWKVLQETDYEKWVQNPGVQEVLSRASVAYRQGIEKFDKLTGQLVSIVDKKEALFSEGVLDRLRLKNLDLDVQNTNKDRQTISLRETPKEIAKEDAKLIKDCVKKVKHDAIDNQIQRLMLELKKVSDPTSSASLMEQIMILKREKIN